MDSSKKVSIIIPVYNTEKYVERCIGSVLKQTYKNIEVIIINDGSKDNSLKIIENTVKNDVRVIVVNEENKGVSYARNVGLSKVSGEYTMFLDGDDYIDKYAIEKLVKLVENNTDVVMFPYIREYANRSYKSKIFNSECTFSGKESYKMIFGSLVGPGGYQKKINPLTKDRINMVWAKLYRTSLVESVKFLDINVIGVEDGWFNINVFKNFRGVVKYTEDVYYHYEKENTRSIVHIYRKNMIQERWNYYRNINKILKQKDEKEFERNMANRIVLDLFGITMNIKNSGLKFKDKVNVLTNILDKYEYDKAFETYEKEKLSMFWRFIFGLFEKKHCVLITLIFQLV